MLSVFSVLEPLVLRVIPVGVIPLIVFLLVVLAFAFIFIVPRLVRFISSEKAE